MAKVKPTCARTGVRTERCAAPAQWRTKVLVAGFVVVLYACGECHAKAPASLGLWEPIAP